MLSYLEKYNQLNPELRQKLSAPEVMAVIKSLETTYQVKLGALVIKLVVNEVSEMQALTWLNNSFNLQIGIAEKIISEIKNRILILMQTPVIALEPEITDDLEQRVEQAMQLIKIDFASQDLKERFRKIVFTYLKGVRNKINTKDSLVKPVENGGLGFDLNSAENILRLIDNKEASGQIKTPMAWSPGGLKPEIKTVARDVEYDLASSIKAKKEAGTLPVVSEEKLLEPPVLSVVEGPVPSLAQKFVSSVVDAPSKQPESRVEPAVVKAKPSPEIIRPKMSTAPIAQENWRRTEAGKIKMDDVMGSPKVFTPVDEIRYMTIKNWRNLSADPIRASELIKKKIEALAAEDYSKKVAGLQAWKESPVNRMYVEAYQEAINGGKSIEAVLSAKQKANPEFLTAQEFEAIITLNQEMKGMLH